MDADKMQQNLGRIHSLAESTRENVGETNQTLQAIKDQMQELGQHGDEMRLIAKALANIAGMLDRNTKIQAQLVEVHTEIIVGQTKTQEAVTASNATAEKMLEALTEMAATLRAPKHVEFDDDGMPISVRPA